MKIILEDIDKIHINGEIVLNNFKVSYEDIWRASYVAYHSDDKAIILKDRANGFIGECSLETSLEYLKKD